MIYQYYLVFISSGGYSSRDNIFIIDELFTDTFKNRSIKIKEDVLLIKMDQSEYDKCSIIIDNIESISWEKRNSKYVDVSRLDYFVLPINLDSIKEHLQIYGKELEYLNTK